MTVNDIYGREIQSLQLIGSGDYERVSIPVDSQVLHELGSLSFKKDNDFGVSIVS